jgi:hypothetical protein
LGIHFKGGERLPTCRILQGRQVAGVLISLGVTDDARPFSLSNVPDFDFAARPCRGNFAAVGAKSAKA